MLLAKGLLAFLPLFTTGQVVSAETGSDPGAAVACDASNVAECGGRCTAGVQRACGDLADLYVAGRGVPKDVPRAVVLYEQACAGGVTSACFSAAALFESGEGIPKNPRRAASAYRQGCAAGDRYACEEHRRLSEPRAEAVRAEASPARSPDRGYATESPPLDAGYVAPGPERVQQLNAERRDQRCRGGDKSACFELGRTALTGAFMGFDAVQVAFKPEVEQRTGLLGGWGGGMRVGVDFWNLWATNAGARFVSVQDSRPIRLDVYECRREYAVEYCDTQPHSEQSHVVGWFLYLETGLQRTLRLSKNLGVAPAVLMGYAATPNEFDRTIPNCEDCPSEDLLDTSAFYVAPALRFVLEFVGVSLRYEHFLSGDVAHVLHVGFDIGAWPAVLNYELSPQSTSRLQGARLMRDVQTP